MSKLKVLELFGGIGACSKALERLGIDYEIADYVEIDKYAVKSFNAIHGTSFEPQDVCKWTKDIEVDLIMHGSPCQDFSLAGLQAGGDEGSGTRSSLMYETIRIVEKLKPKYVIWENVKNVISKKHKHNYDNYCNKMTELGYTNYGQVLNAKDYGIPQNRERVFTISIRKDLNQTFQFPAKQELKLRLKDMLEENVDEKCYLSDKMIEYISATGTANFRNPDSKINLDIARPLTTDQNKRAGTTNYLCKELPDNYNLKIKNATKLGYLEAEEGDGIDISSRMQYHRGNVQKQTSQTISTMGGNNVGVVVLGNYSPSNYESSRIVDNDYIAPTVKENHGTVTAIVENQPKVIGDIGEKKSNNGTQWYQQDRIYDNNVGLSLSTTAQPYYPDNNLRIRKLTPKECWRLMGFDDSDFDKASKVNSNTQLYKQAGNSIVVNVLEGILKELLCNMQ